MHWDALLDEVLNKKTKKPVLISSSLTPPTADIARKQAKKYFLGAQYEGVYFTNREAEVMVRLLQGKTLHVTAQELNLSPRTVEFYVKNMKSKLACRTKFELVGKVFASNFVKEINFIATLTGE